MKRSNHHKNLSLSYSNIHYYQPLGRNYIDQHLFETTRGSKQEDTFRKKKVSTCHELNYSSCLNPFTRARNSHYDQTVKQYERKRKVVPASNLQTDPVTLRYQQPEKQIRVRPQFKNSLQYMNVAEKKYFLPSQREISGSRRKYYSHVGMSHSLQKIPQTRVTQNSTRLKQIIEYNEADHRLAEVTSKIGTRARK